MLIRVFSTHGRNELANNASSKSFITLHIGGRSHHRGKSSKDEECHHCGQKGHFKHDCCKWKEERKEKKIGDGCHVQ